MAESWGQELEGHELQAAVITAGSLEAWWRARCGQRGGGPEECWRRPCPRPQGMWESISSVGRLDCMRTAWSTKGVGEAWMVYGYQYRLMERKVQDSTYRQAVQGNSSPGSRDYHHSLDVQSLDRKHWGRATGGRPHLSGGCQALQRGQHHAPYSRARKKRGCHRDDGLASLTRGI